MSRITKAEIEFGFVDSTATEDAEYSASQKQTWNDIEQLKEEDEGNNYSTLELNSFILDGNAELFPVDPEDEFFGWWSRDLSGADCSFATAPVLTITFDDEHSSAGITLKFPEFENSWASSVNIKWYDEDSAILCDKNYSPNASIYFCKQSVIDFKKIVITFNEMAMPKHYLKLRQVLFGTIKFLKEDVLESVKIYEEIDPVSSTLPISTMEFSIFDKEGEFSPLNPSIYLLLQERQWFKVRGYINGQKYEMGTYYYSDFEASEPATSMAVLNCIDIIGVIDKYEFRGGIYDNVLAGTVIEDIMEAAGLETDEWEFDTQFSSTYLTGWIPVCTCREALRQVVFAIGGAVDCTRGEVLKIIKITNPTATQIADSRKIEGHKITRAVAVTGCEVTAHKYWKPMETDIDDERTRILKEVMSSGVHEIKFDNPHYNYYLLQSPHATIQESGANYVILNVTQEETVTLTGEEYKDSTKLFEYSNGSSVKRNVVSVNEDMTLINKANAETIAQRVYNYYQNQYTDEGDVIMNVSNDKVMSRICYSGGITGIVTSVDIDLTGGIIGSLKVVGGVI